MLKKKGKKWMNKIFLISVREYVNGMVIKSDYYNRFGLLVSPRR